MSELNEVELRRSAARKLRAFDGANVRALLGLDGFVDNIIDVVDRRSDAENYARVEKLGALGQRIERASGLSTNIELVVRQEKLGGNGPIMANALIEAGLSVSYIGSLGRTEIHSVFHAMAARCRECITLCDPGMTDALEFQDGKLMLCKVETLKQVTYARMLEVVGLAKLREMWSNCNLIALTNWTMLVHQTEIWRRLAEDMEGIKAPSGAVLFIDLADPEKRVPQDLVDACHLLRRFKSNHFVVLGLNQKESAELGRALNLELSAEDIAANAARLRAALDLDAIVIHPTKSAACATSDRQARVSGPYCANPVLTTGAGDNFNAGFCLGVLAKLEFPEALAAATATSGFYVRHGHSPNRQQLVAFLEEWNT